MIELQKSKRFMNSTFVSRPGLSTRGSSLNSSRQDLSISLSNLEIMHLHDSHIFEKHVTTREKIEYIWIDYIFPMVTAIVLYLFNGYFFEWFNLRCYGSFDTASQDCPLFPKIYLVIQYTILAIFSHWMLQYLICQKYFDSKEKNILMGSYLVAYFIFMPIYFFSGLLPEALTSRSRTFSVLLWLTVWQTIFSAIFLKDSKYKFSIQKSFLIFDYSVLCMLITISLFFAYFDAGLSFVGLNESYKRMVLDYTMQPILDTIHSTYFQKVLKRKKNLEEEDLVWFIRLFDAFGDGFKASFWLTMEYDTVAFWYNSVLFFVGKVDENTGFMARKLNRAFAKVPYLNKYFGEYKPEYIDKIINGINLFDFLPISVIFLLRAFNFPFLYELIGFDMYNFKFDVQGETDFAEIYSLFKLGIAVLFPLLATLTSIFINYRTGKDTIKILIVDREGIANKIALFIIGQKLLCMMILGIELAMFANSLTNKDYWNFMCKFY